MEQLYGANDHGYTRPPSQACLLDLAGGRRGRCTGSVRRADASMFEVLGREHPYVIGVRAEFAMCTALTGDVIGALKQFSALLPETERTLGGEHVQTLATRASLAAMTDAAGDKAKAREQLAALLSLARQVLGPRHPITHAVRGNLFRVEQELEG